MEFTAQDWHAIVADDDDDWRNLVSRTLRRAGFEVVEASNGEELLAFHRTIRTSTNRRIVVISDVDMPKCDGITAVIALRCVAASVPILLVTGLADESTHLRAFEAGANVVLTKPLAAQAVLDAMRKLLPELSNCS
jgi:two-component system chemotaxis response regulator CheY